MTIDDIDFAQLYRDHLAQAERTRKDPEHWDKRAEKMAQNCANPADPYLIRFKGIVDTTGAKTLLDVGCGPGSVALQLADSFEQVTGIDYSEGMLKVARQRAETQGCSHVTFRHCAWEDDWSALPPCDIAVASRSTLVMDLQAALLKLNRHARLRVYTTHTVSPTFVDIRVIRAIGRTPVTLPTYIYAVNILNQLGIHPDVEFIRSPNCQSRDNMTFEQFAEGVVWSLGQLDDHEMTLLRRYYDQQAADGLPVVPATRDWAMVSWNVVPESALLLPGGRK